MPIFYKNKKSSVLSNLERSTSSNAEVAIGAIATIDNTFGDTFVSRIYQV